ncbi:DUF3276 family protein [Chloroflexota bacterium]
MGKEQESPISKQVRAGNRTYFFDLKETKGGKDYLLITESKYMGEDQEQAYEKQRIAVFPEQALEFLAAIQAMVGEIS